MREKKKKKARLFSFSGEYTEPQSPRKPTCHPRVRACSLQNTASLETRGPAQREISYSGGIKGTCCYGNAPQVSPEAQEEKAWGGREHRETPSKEARGHRGSRGREPGVSTALPPTPGCSPDTPSTSCSSPLARPASPAGVAVWLAVPSPVTLPTLEGELAKAVLFCCDSPATQHR